MVNISAEAINAQKIEKDEAIKAALEKKKAYEEGSYKKKVEFDEKHYLNTILSEGETQREITIRLLPFSSTELSPFKKVHVHSVKAVNKDGVRKWKLFMCPIGMKKSDSCPFCEAAAEAKRLKFETTDADMKKKYNELEFMNSSKDYWIVRCIDRDHEEDGVKFWRFPDSRKGDGIWDKMYNLFETRNKRGTNIFDLYEGKDIIVTIKREKNDKGKENTVCLIQDDDRIKPLAATEEQMAQWVNDPMTLDDVYSTKDYDFLSLVLNGKFPVWSKNLNRWIGKDEAEQINNEARVQQIQENLMPQVQDFSSFTVDTGATRTEVAIEKTRPMVNEPEDDGLPF